MEKQFGKPLTLKGLENGDLADSKYSITRLAQIESGKISGKKNIESGHLHSLRTKDHQRKAGKAGGIAGIDQFNSLKTKQHQSQAGKIGGKTGGKIVGNKFHICPYCNKEGKGPTMFRFHFNNCKLNPLKSS
jgi:hypothetical protein